MPDSPSASPPAVHQLKISNLPPIAAPDTLIGTSATTSNRLNTVSPRMYRTILCLLERSSLSHFELLPTPPITTRAALLPAVQVVVSRRAISARRNDGRGDNHQAKTCG